MSRGPGRVDHVTVRCAFDSRYENPLAVLKLADHLSDCDFGSLETCGKISDFRVCITLVLSEQIAKHQATGWAPLALTSGSQISASYQAKRSALRFRQLEPSDFAQFQTRYHPCHEPSAVAVARMPAQRLRRLANAGNCLCGSMMCSCWVSQVKCTNLQESCTPILSATPHHLSGPLSQRPSPHCASLLKCHIAGVEGPLIAMACGFPNAGFPRCK